MARAAVTRLADIPTERQAPWLRFWKAKFESIWSDPYLDQHMRKPLLQATYEQAKAELDEIAAAAQQEAETIQAKANRKPAFAASTQTQANLERLLAAGVPFAEMVRYFSEQGGKEGREGMELLKSQLNLLAREGRLPRASVRENDYEAMVKSARAVIEQSQRPLLEPHEVAAHDDLRATSIGMPFIQANQARLGQWLSLQLQPGQHKSARVETLMHFCGTPDDADLPKGLFDPMPQEAQEGLPATWWTGRTR